MATSKKSTGVSKWVTRGLTQYLKRTGWDLEGLCLSFVGYEGSPTHVRYEKALVGKIVKRHGGIGVGQGPGALYDQKKFDTPYIRDFLLDRGAMADVSETASPWSSMLEIHDTVVERFHETRRELGLAGYIMCHLSHGYHSGACQYFTFALTDSGPDALVHYDAVKRAIQQVFVDLGATVSHHHGVGEEHSPWLEQDISPGGVRLQRALFAGIDPDRRANPGKIVHEGVPGISSNSLPST
jgi:alkyldihydroxyacetonephosphate synthase